MNKTTDFTTIIVITPKDFPRLVKQYKRLVQNIPSRDFIFVSGDGIREELVKADLGDNVSYVHESTLLKFEDVRDCMQAHLNELLMGDAVPRGAIGWYYQQFLKMQYAYICEDEYYMTWDGDTIPCKPFSMFQEETGAPYMDMKQEYHALYFETLEKLLPGMRKCINPSFISEHMLFNVKLMKQLIERIESNDAIPGTKFWEKIIHAIDPMRICDSGFSEFETYGTFVAFTNPSLYKLREWHSFRLAGEFFDPETICDRDYEWLGKDFHAISFEKNQFVRDDNKNLFDNPEYQAKLSARKMLEIAQEEFNGGYIEVWGNSASTAADPLASSGNTKPEYKQLADLGASKTDTNVNQAYLCYEQAHFLCKDEILKKSYMEAMETLKQSPDFTLRKAAICIVSYNAKKYMEECIRSIRFTCAPDSYEIVVTDNASTDGVTDYLKSLGDKIILFANPDNPGFPGGCNLCIKNASVTSDIFLLNNDTRMTHNALFWLRYGLYEDENTGAVGCMGSFAGNEQMINLGYPKPEDYLEYALHNNVYKENQREEKSRLCGFAMLIRRDVLDKVGLLDETFAPGYYEDDDLSLRICEAGYRMYVIHNSFIYHKGSESFNSTSEEAIQKQERLNKLLLRNYEYSMKKNGYDNLTAATIFEPEKNVFNTIVSDGKKIFSLLEINAGSGNFLSMLKYTFPDAQLIGTSAIDGELTHAVKNVQLIKYNPLADNLSCEPHSFDYILVRVSENSPYYISPEKAKEKYACLVKEGGKLLYLTI